MNLKTYLHITDSNRGINIGNNDVLTPNSPAVRLASLSLLLFNDSLFRGLVCRHVRPDVCIK